MSREFTANDLGLTEDQFNYTPDFTPTTTPTKVDTLASAKQRKLERLGNVVTPSWVDETKPNGENERLVSDDGRFEDHYGNKIANSLEDNQYQYLLGQSVNDLGVYKSGDKFVTKNSKGEMEEFTGDMDDYSIFYGYGGKGGDDWIKPGISRADLGDSDYRYQPKRALNEGVDNLWKGGRSYGEAPGVGGVDLNDKQFELFLPKGVAKTLEKLGHGRDSALADRVARREVGNSGEYNRLKALLGSSPTEMYKSTEGFFGDSRDDPEFNKGELYKEFLGLSGYSKVRNKTSELGSIANKYESGTGGVGTISSGIGDAGGVSYGNYQIASDAGTMSKFLESDQGSRFSKFFKGMKPGSDEFNTQYNKVVGKFGDKLEVAQKEFIAESHYEPVKQLGESLGLDTSDRMIQEALWSQSVQHSYKGNRQILSKALNGLGNDASVEEQVRAIYQSRLDYASEFMDSTSAANRYSSEMKDVLALGNGSSGTAGSKEVSSGDYYRDQRHEAELETMGVLGRALNTGKAAVGTLAKVAVVDFADWVGDATGLWDIGTKEEKAKMVNDTFSYNPRFSEEASRKAGILAERIYKGMNDDDSEVKLADVAKLVWEGVTPELGAESIATVAAMFIPWLGVTKAAKTGHEAISTFKKGTEVLQKSAGLLQWAAGQTNNEVDEYKEVHNSDPSIMKVSTIMITNVAMGGLDRLAMTSIIKSPLAVQELVGAMKAIPIPSLPREGRVGLVVKGLGVAAGLAGNMGKEAGQEYIQAMGEVLNVQLNIDDNGTVVSVLDEAGELLVDEETVIKGITGAGLGAGGSLQFSAVGAGLKVTGVSTSGAIEQLREYKDKKSSVETERSVNREAKEDQEVSVKRSQESSEEVVKEFETSGEVPTLESKLRHLIDNAPSERIKVAAINRLKEVLQEQEGAIYGSSMADVDKARKVASTIELLAANGLTDTEFKAIVDTAKAQVPDMADDMDLGIGELSLSMAREAGEVRKSMSEVSNDVAKGSKGFLTYYDSAMEGIESADEGLFNESVVKLVRFQAMQEGKLASYVSAIREVEAEVNSQVAEVMDRKELDREGALKVVQASYKSLAKKKVHKFEHAGNKNYVAYDTVIETMLKTGNALSEDNQPEVGYGVYGTVLAIAGEVRSMELLSTRLAGYREGATNDSEQGQNIADVQKELRKMQSARKEAGAVVKGDKEPEVGVGKEEVKSTTEKVDTEVKEESTQEANKEVEQEVATEVSEATVDDEVDNSEDSGEINLDDFRNMSFDASELGDVFEVDEDVPTTETNGESIADIMSSFETFNPEDFGMDDFDTSDVDQLQLDQEAMDEVTGDSSTRLPDKVKSDTVVEVESLLARLKDLGTKAKLSEEGGVKLTKEEVEELHAAVSEVASFRLYNDVAQKGIPLLVHNVRGEKARPLGDVYRVSMPTGLNLIKAEFTPAVTKVANTLFEAIKVPNRKTGYDGQGVIGIADLKKNPALAYLYKPTVDFGDDSKVVVSKKLKERNSGDYSNTSVADEMNANTVVAIEAGVLQYMSENAVNLVKRRTLDEATELLGVTKDDDAGAPIAAYVLKHGGGLMKFEADSLGAVIVKNLGITKGEETTDTEMAMLVTSFGNIGLVYAAKAGLIHDFTQQQVVGEQITKLPMGNDASDTSGSVLIKPTDQYFESRKATLTRMIELENQFSISIDSSRNYKVVKPKEKTKAPVKNNPYTVANPRQVKALNKLESIGYKVNDGVQALRGILGEATKSSLMKAIGYKEYAEGDKSVSYDERDAQRSRNIEIKNNVEAMLELLTNDGDTEVFFEWFLTKAGRYQLDSSKVNPQNDKQLARWLVTASATRVQLSKSTINEFMSDGNTSNLSDEDVMFLYGIVQAFDGSKLADGIAIDKNNQSKILAQARKIIGSSIEDQQEAALVSDHLGHAALAIANIEKLLDGNEEFGSTMVVEIDGLTNGFSYKVMQTPTGNAKKWLFKVGLIAEDKISHMSMNEMDRAKENDVYLEGGSVLASKVGQLSEVGMKSTVNPNDPEKSIEVDVSPIDVAWDRLGLTSDLTVSKGLRNIMKTPVMIFNYGAGLFKIVDDVISGEKEVMVAGLLEVGRDGNYVVTDKQLREVAGGGSTQQEDTNWIVEARAELTEKSLDSLSELDAVLTNYLEAKYKVEFIETLDEVFGDYLIMNKAMSELSEQVFAVFKKEYDKEVDKIGLKVTSSDKNGIVKKLIESGLAPAIDTASSTSAKDKLFLYQRALDKDVHTETSKIELTGDREFLTTSLLARGFRSPGASALVLPVQTSDGNTMGQSLVDSDKGFLSVHDAAVLGIGQMGEINILNKNWYEDVRQYTPAEALLDMGTKAYELSGSEKLQEAVGKLEVFVDDVRARRKELFSTTARAGQFVGPIGSAYEVTPDVIRDRNRKAVKKEYNALVESLVKLGSKEDGIAIRKLFDSSVLKKKLDKAGDCL
jgi:hypothetical protein